MNETFEQTKQRIQQSRDEVSNLIEGSEWEVDEDDEKEEIKTPISKNKK